MHYVLLIINIYWYGGYGHLSVSSWHIITQRQNGTNINMKYILCEQIFKKIYIFRMLIRVQRA